MDGEAMLAAVPVFMYFCFGLVYCFFGYHFLKVMMVSLGCFFGLGVGMLIANVVFGGNTVAFVALGVLGALGGGFLFAMVYNLAIFMAGFAVGGLFSPLLVELLEVDAGSLAGVVIVLLAGALCGMLALLLEKQIMIFFSSAIGAIIATVALQLLIRNDYPLAPNDVAKAYAKAFEAFWWLILGLMIGGVSFQWKRKSKARA